MIGRPRRLVRAFALVAMSACSRERVAPAGEAHWVAGFGASPEPCDPPLTVAGQSVRQTVRLTLTPTRVRVRLSNAEGRAAVRIGAAHVALAGIGASVVPGSDRALTFGGAPRVSLPPGAVLVSDPVALPTASRDLAVSLYFPDAVDATTGHAVGQTSYLSAPGDLTAAPTWDGATKLDAGYVLAGVEVLAPSNAAAIVTLGDSLTDGMGSTEGAYHSWPSLLAERLAARSSRAPRAVVNEGISGNCILRDLVGTNALARLDRDVLSQAGAKYVVVLEGTNDLGATVRPPAVAPTAEEIIGGHAQIVLRAHALGFKAFGGTLPPIEGMDFPGFSATPAAEEKRATVNRWIRTSGVYDAVIDFDRALRDPARPTRLLPAFDSGDHGHPNDAGYEAMANAVDLTLFDDTP